MFDSRFEERKKNFQTDANFNPCKRREEFGLKLRKEKLYQHIMEKRLNNKLKHTTLEIDPASLNIPEIMKETYEKANSSERIDYIIKWLTEDDKMSENNLMSDTRKYALYKLRLLTEDLELNPDEDLKLTEELIQVLLYELFDSCDITVKYEISIVLTNLSNDSRILNETLLDVVYFEKFLVLTYSNCVQLIENILIIFGNVISDNTKEDVNQLTYSVAIIPRMKDILSITDFVYSDNLKSLALWNLSKLVSKFKEERYIIFVDFIPIFAKYFELPLIQNVEILMNLLSILSNISRDEKFVAETIVQCGIVKHIIELLSRKSMEREMLSLCLNVIGNLMYASDQIVNYILNLKILDIFEKLLNTYMNSIRKEDKDILVEIIWIVANITAGTEDHIDRVILYSNIPKFVLRIYKYKNDNKILYECLILFYNSLCKGSNTAVIEILKTDFMRLVCDSINNSDDVKILQRALNMLLKVMQISKNIYYTYMNIKNELQFNNSLIKIEKCINHKNEEISKKANQILNLFDLDAPNSDSNKVSLDAMDCEM